VRDRGIGGEKAFQATARAHGVATAKVRAIALEGALYDWQYPPAPKLPQAPMLPPSRQLSATRLTATTRCSETELRMSIAALRWRPAASPGREQRVVVTIYRTFAEGYESSGPLRPDRSAFQWHRVHGHAIHSWRVVTRQSGGWAPSKPRRFVGPLCMADMQPTGGPVP
jgi:hypothetical protein